ncbi:urease accessory protein UreF [Terrarubrum flagellatum]|uniref:urease accessory protein UreF n=1 Tax=Terrirubrum flagellatum TaxID=2895980 RepID=UPI003144D56B
MITITTMDTDIGAATEAAALPLFAWLSPSYPVGAYAYSHGLEWLVETGEVKDRDTLIEFLRDILAHGGGRNDAIFFVETYRAALNDTERLGEIAELAAAFAPSRERKLESLQQGRAFMDATLAAWPAHDLAMWAAKTGDEIAYPVAVALACAAHRMPLQSSLEAYLLAFASNLASAVVRAVPLGQTDGQRAIAALAPLVREIAASALEMTLDDLGGAALRIDLAAMHHETQYTRLFRS